MSVISSSDTVTNASERDRYSRSIFTRSGNSSRHGSQNVTQKLTSNGPPRCCVISPLSASVSIGETTGKGLRGFVARPFFRWAGAVRPTNKMHNATGMIAFEKRMVLRSFNAATESLGFCLFNCLAPERGVESVAEVACFNLRGVAGVVDATVIDKLVVRIEEVSFGRYRGAEPVGNLVAWILQDREGEFVFGGVSFNCGRIFRDVRVNADDGDAFRFVIRGEFFHALVVGVGNRTLDRDEQQHRAVFSGE